MLLTEYNPKKHIRQEREEAREEGRSEGIELGTLRGIEALIAICQEYHLPEKDIECRLCEKYGITEAQAREYMDQFWK